MFDIYVGEENLSNYYQKKANVAASQFFSPYVDASMIWGPITRKMLYAGVECIFRDVDPAQNNPLIWHDAPYAILVYKAAGRSISIGV